MRPPDHWAGRWPAMYRASLAAPGPAAAGLVATAGPAREQPAADATRFRRTRPRRAHHAPQQGRSPCFAACALRPGPAAIGVAAVHFRPWPVATDVPVPQHDPGAE